MKLKYKVYVNNVRYMGFFIDFKSASASHLQWGNWKVLLENLVGYAMSFEKLQKIWDVVWGDQ